MKRVFFGCAMIVAMVAMPLTAKMQVGGNMWFHSDWSGTTPFVDQMLDARDWEWTTMTDQGSAFDPYPFGGVTVPTGFTADVDTSGYPNEVPMMYNSVGYRPYTIMLPEIPATRYPFGKFTLQFEGKGQIVLGWDYKDTIDGTGGLKTVEFTITSVTPSVHFPDKSSGLVLSILRSDRSDHIRNIHVIMPGFESVWKQQPFHPDYIKDCRPFSVIRFMDWCGANKSKVSSWGNRRKMSSMQTSEDGVAWEWIIAAGNTFKRDIWVCVPSRADEQYWRNLATMLRDRMDPTLKIYIEWGNETWNGMFEGATVSSEKFQAAGLSNPWSYHGYISVRMFKVFKEVFGASAAQRLVTVVSGQAANSGVLNDIVGVIQSTQFNPDQIMPNLCAITQYFNGTAPPSTSEITAHKTIAARINAGVVAYEGGSGSMTNSGPVYATYTTSLTNMENAGLLLYNEYTIISPWQTGGSENWGAKQYQGQPMADAPKYKALYDFQVKNGFYNPNEQFSSVLKPSPRSIAPMSMIRSPQSYSTFVFDCTGRLITRVPLSGISIDISSAPAMYLLRLDRLGQTGVKPEMRYHR